MKIVFLFITQMAALISFTLLSRVASADEFRAEVGPYVASGTSGLILNSTQLGGDLGGTSARAISAWGNAHRGEIKLLTGFPISTDPDGSRLLALELVGQYAPHGNHSIVAGVGLAGLHAVPFDRMGHLTAFLGSANGKIATGISAGPDRLVLLGIPGRDTAEIYGRAVYNWNIAGADSYDLGAGIAVHPKLGRTKITILGEVRHTTTMNAISDRADKGNASLADVTDGTELRVGVTVGTSLTTQAR